MHVIEIINVSKRFGNKQVLKEISFSLNDGKILGLLGPNGAGKTTLLKIICGLVRPSAGEVILEGVTRTEIATIFEDQRFLGHLSGIKNMKLFMSSIYGGHSSLVEKFKEFGLEESKNAKFKFYSSGMKKRVDIMSAFVSGKRLYLLDEPTNALDIESMNAFNKQVISLKNDGKSVIIASHHALEMERLCDSFLLIDRGAIVSKMTREELLNNFISLESAYSSVIHKP
jgi:ABC-2 type transport system ATP-binding protein